MGIAIPQVITSDRASGAQVIDGSLKFNASAHLTRTPSSAGNRNTWTWSGWVKRSDLTTSGNSLFAAYDSSTARDVLRFDRSASGAELNLQSSQGSNTYGIYSNAKLRDTGWYHVVAIYDDTNSTTADKQQLYVNGERLTSVSTENNGQDGGQTTINNTDIHYIGARSSDGNPSLQFDGAMSQVYFIDGQALDASYFGYTDPLTNTWKPKKYSGDFSYTLTAPTYDSSGGSDVTTTEFAKMVDGDLSTYGQGTGASGTNRFIGFSLAATKYPTINIKIKNTTGSALDFFIQPDEGSGYTNGGTFASSGGNSVNVAGGVTHEDTYTFPANYSGTGRIYLNNSGNAADAWEIYDFGGTKVTTNSFYLPFDASAPIGQDKSGNGNDWTPVNFGGSVELDKSTGAKPILNTTQGGARAGVGVFGSKQNVGYAVTVYNDGGGNKYYIDGVKQATLTGLIRGATYTFDQTDSSNSTHPLVFGTTTNGNDFSNGVSITGSPGSTGITSITIPYNAPNTLYYHCSAHNNMGSSITGITTNEKLADQYASDCIFATPFVGIKSDVSVSVACTSTEKSLTDVGTPVGVTTNSVFYGESFYYSGSAAHDLGVINDTTFEIGSADFCIEGWFNSNVTLDASVWNPIITLPWHGNDNGESQIWIGFAGAAGGVYSAGEFHARIRDSSGIKELPSGLTTLYNDNTWHHFAVTKNGTLAAIFVDGVLKKTVVTEASLNTGLGDQKGYIGVYDNNTGTPNGVESGAYLKGYLNDIRIYKGAAKYVGVTTGVQYFVPPSTSPDILPDTPSGATGSKLTKITDGAVIFDGTNDKLSITAHSDLDLSSGDFTVEGFVYPLRSQEQAFVNNWNSGGQFQVQMSSSGTLQASWAPYSLSDYAVTGTTPVRVNAWSHFAYTRSGSTFELFLDGVSQGTQTSSANGSTNNNIVLGENGGNADRDFQGFLSNVRIIKGTALYTANFTPPTAPLTNVTNTKLLCCQSPTNVRLSPVGPNVGITTTTRFNSNFESIPTTVNGLTVTNNGSVTTTSAGTNSYGFTNCADLDGSNSLSVDLGTIPALTTIDLVFKVTGTSDNKYVFGIGGNGLVRRSSSSFDWYNGSDTDITTSEIADGNWHHLRVTPTRLYFDNTLIENNTSLQFINNNTTADGDNSGHMALGAFRNGSGTIQYNGAIDFGLVRVMPGVDLGAPSSYPITTNGTLSDTETIPSDGIIVARGGSAATTLSSFNTDINTVRGQETGYPTWSPLVASTSTFSDGNLTITTQASDYVNDLVTMRTPAGTGKWYWEFVQTARTGTDYTLVGMLPDDNTYKQGLSDIPQNCGGIGLYIGQNGVAYVASGAATAGTTTATFDVGDLLGWAFDAENGTVKCFKNGVPQGTQFTDVRTDTGWTFCVTDYDHTTVSTFEINFGQKPFKFSPPDGYQSLNAANVRPETVIARPDQYVGIVTYTGDAPTAQQITGLNFGTNPDFVWVKNYSDATGYHHGLFDTVRGANKVIVSSDTSGPAEVTTTQQLMSFDHNGFTVGTNSDSQNYVNLDADDYVAWCWKAGGAPTATNNNTSGAMDANSVSVDGVLQSAYTPSGSPTIYPTGMSVGTKQGFSIIRYQANSTAGATIPHGLSKAPTFVLVKSLETSGSSNSDWTVFHSTMGGTNAVYLNETSASAASGSWNDTNPNANVITLGTAHVSNLSPNHYIAYAWHDVLGLQKFGSFEGNGNADGPFVELGFEPAVVILKNIDNYGSGYDWFMFDNQRDKNNVCSSVLLANSSDDASSTNSIDFLSNGFKLRATTNGINLSSHTIIYMAWAAAPSVDLFGGGANAR